MEFFYEYFRCKALDVEQNNVLHQHLDNVSSQAARIRQAADSSVGTPRGEEEDCRGHWNQSFLSFVP